MNIFLLISMLANVIASLFLSFFFLRKKGTGIFYKNFSYTLLILSAFYLSFFAMQLQNSEVARVFLAELMMSFIIIFPLFIFRAILLFLDKFVSYKKVFYFLSFICIVFLGLNHMGMFIEDVHYRGDFEYLPLVSKYFEYYSIYLFSFVFISISILSKKYFFSSSHFKRKIRNAVLVTVLLYLALVADFFAWYGIDIPLVGSVVLNLLLLVLIYFFLAKRIIDFKLAFRKSTVTVSALFSMFVIIIALKYSVAILAPNVLIWDDYFILILAVFLYPVIKKQLFLLANRYFFTSLYDPGKVITRFNKALRSIIDLNEIYELLDKTFTHTFHTKSFALLFYDKNDTKYTIEYNTGFNIYADAEFKSDSMLHRKYIEKDIIAPINLLSKDIHFKDRKFIKLLNHFKIDLVVPLVLKEKVIGVMILSGKESGDSYNKEDLGVLSLISSQATVAIDNALKYEETKKFKFKLQREIKRATQELRIVNKELKRVDVDKSGFISIASHQLRTPLTVIKGYSSMILEGNFGKLEAVTKDAMTKVFISSSQLINLVEDLLDISRIESGKEVYEFKKGQLEDLIDNIVEGLALSSKDKKVKLTWEKPKTPLSSIQIDKEKLRQSCMNLIENAIKYTSKANREDAEVKVLISEDTKNKTIKVTINDNGLGITKDDMKNLFTKFYRGKNKSIVATEGTGLGLYVAKQIIEKHGGEISVKSEGEGKGAEFSFWIPTIKK